jgi:hypothetical protein
MEFMVNQEMTDQLNADLEAISKLDVSCWLDRDHDWKTRIFSPITRFEFVEGEGVFAIGLWTPDGQALRDSSRISGVSVNMSFVDGKSVPSAYRLEVPPRDRETLARRQSSPPPTSTTPQEEIGELAILGGVLIDGHRSAIQPYRTQTEQWKEILDGMARTGANAISRRAAS